MPVQHRKRSSRRKGDRAFASAVRAADLGAIRDALDAGADVNAPMDFSTALYQSLAEGVDPVVELLLAHPAIDIDRPTGSGAVPLDAALLGAARTRDGRWVDHLLERGADPSALDDHGRSPLWRAIDEHPDRLGWIERLATPSNVNPANLRFAKDHPLRMAVAKDVPDVVALLLARGARLDGESLLCLAAEQAAAKVLGYLLAAGADPNERDGTGTPAIVKVASHRTRGSEALERLLEAHVDLDARAADGATALYEASALGHADLVRRLLAAGADATRPGRSDRPPLFAVAISCSEEIAQMLIDAGAGLDVVDADGRNVASHSAAQLENAREGIGETRPGERRSLRPSVEAVVRDSEHFLAWLTRRGVTPK